MRIVTILLVLLFSGTAFAQEARPPLWRLSDEDTTIYLFGTVHLLKPGTEWMTGDIEAALAGSQALYMEVSLAEQQNVPKIQALVQKYGMLPEGQTLSASLPPEQAATLVNGMTAMGLDKAVVERFKPWFAGTTFANLKFQQLGYNPASGVEAALGSMAEAHGVPIAGLETLEFQLAMFSAMGPEETAAYIKDLLDDQDKLSAMMTDITTSWAKGDLQELDDEINNLDDISPKLAERILYSRNRTWAGEIETMLEDPGQFFVAVGSGHFVGDRSVIELLEQNGITVTRVQ